MKRQLIAIAALFFSLIVTPVFADPGSITVDLQHPGTPISPTFYGLMTEEINHSYDGGLYAELIQNRAFNDNAKDPVRWSLVKDGTADGNMALDDSVPPNTALKKSLKVSFTATSPQSRAGVANEGYWGIPVRPNTQYRASIYARGDDHTQLSGGLQLSIESNDRKTVYATATIPQIDSNWKKYEAVLNTKDVQPTADAHFVISAAGSGTVWLDEVSLFPPTYNNRPNGNRIDLMQMLADLHPTFLRFPGGNYLEGDTIAERFEWKDTIGPIENRPGHRSPWNYHSSDGMGLLEFLNWCEDLHMQPVLAVFAGYVLRHAEHNVPVHVNAGKDLEPYVQDALDEIEYCTGDASTKWGQQRAKDGHPEPFAIPYVEIGNEDWFDRPGGNYDARYSQFYDAIKAKYPKIQLIATAPVESRNPDVMDDHYYRSSRAMERDVRHYDRTDRDGPKIFVGEWATREGRPTPNFGAAMADAAWLTGLERDSDLVVMNSYAPLFINVSGHGASQWDTDLIGYNALNSFGSASYYAQKMFAGNMGDTVLPVRISEQKVTDLPPPPAPTGRIGLGTWNTQVQFKDAKVTSGDKVLFQSDFTKGTSDWRPGDGDWSVVDGALAQTSDATNCRMTAGDMNWTDYTYEVKARKTGGSEGFLIMFHARGRNDFIWWNVGGWGNTRTQLQKMVGGDNADLGPSSDATIETNRWYDVRIELKGTNIKCYLDNKLITETTDTERGGTLSAVYASASRADKSGEVILKVVNISGSPQTLAVNLKGATDVEKDGKVTVLTGKPSDVNSIADPTKVMPVDSELHDAGASFVHEFPGYSFTVMRLTAK